MPNGSASRSLACLSTLGMSHGVAGNCITRFLTSAWGVEGSGVAGDGVTVRRCHTFAPESFPAVLVTPDYLGPWWR
jgi:hypothetical protein